MTNKHTPETTRDIILTALEDNKAEDIIIIPLKGKSAIADYMIVASGRSARHVVGLSNHIADALAKNNITKVKFEGKDNGDWVLGDAGDIIIHLFRPEVRDFYNIEKIWCDPEFLEHYEAKKQSMTPTLADA
jgi:ribosome-associated protein